MNPGEDRIGQTQLGEGLAVGVQRDDPGHLPPEPFELGRVQRRGAGQDSHSELDGLAVLSGRHPDLALLVVITAERHPHHAVEGQLVSVAETHQGHLGQVVRSADVQGRHLRRFRHGSHSAVGH